MLEGSRVSPEGGVSSRLKRKDSRTSTASGAAVASATPSMPRAVMHTTLLDAVAAAMEVPPPSSSQAAAPSAATQKTSK